MKDRILWNYVHKATAETLSPHCGVLVEWTKGNKAFACLSSSKS